MKHHLLTHSLHLGALTRRWKLTLLSVFLITGLLPHKLLADSGGIFQADIILNSKNTRDISYRLDANPGAGGFYGVTFGPFTTDETFLLKGADVLTYKNGDCDVTGARIEYLVYLAGNRPNEGICNIGLPFRDDRVNGVSGDQRWRQDTSSVNLLRGLLPGSYVLEVYIEADVARCSTGSNGIKYFSNSGANYIAYFNVTAGTVPVVPYPAGCNRPLPVALTVFDAKREEANTRLSWETASEVNSHGYEVQVATDSRTFRTLGFITSKGEGTNSSRQYYSYLDTEPGKAGLRYYRLRQVDHDGKEHFYGPRVVVFDKAGSLASLMASPNPFTGEVVLTMSPQSMVRTGTVVLTDMLGRTAINQPLTLVAGVNQVRLPELDKLPKGLYHLRLSLNGELQSVKLLKE